MTIIIGMAAERLNRGTDERVGFGMPNNLNAERTESDIQPLCPMELVGN